MRADQARQGRAYRPLLAPSRRGARRIQDRSGASDRYLRRSVAGNQLPPELENEDRNTVQTAQRDSRPRALSHQGVQRAAKTTNIAHSSRGPAMTASNSCSRWNCRPTRIETMTCDDFALHGTLPRSQRDDRRFDRNDLSPGSRIDDLRQLSGGRASGATVRGTGAPERSEKVQDRAAVWQNPSKVTP